MPRSCPSLLAVVALCTATGCVIGRPARASRSESAQGPSAVPVSGSPVVPQNSPDTDEAPPPATPPKQGGVWVRGYWHWDGVSYVWQRGHWEHALGGG